MGDPSDEATRHSFEELEADDENDETTNAVATGKLNAGKLLSTNKTSGENRITALDTVGIICDLIDIHTENKPGKPNTTDMVGTRCKSKTADLAEKPSTTRVKLVAERVNARATTTDVIEGPIE